MCCYRGVLERRRLSGRWRWRKGRNDLGRIDRLRSIDEGGRFDRLLLMLLLLMMRMRMEDAVGGVVSKMARCLMDVDIGGEEGDKVSDTGG